MSSTQERCPGCGWHKHSADSHAYYHVRSNLGCPVLRAKYSYRLTDTPRDWLDPVHDRPRPGVWSLWRRSKGTDEEWEWLAYL